MVVALWIFANSGGKMESEADLGHRTGMRYPLLNQLLNELRKVWIRITGALLLSGQGLEKAEFRRIIVIFLTAVDFVTFFYFLWIGLINAEMLLQNLRLLPAMILGFLADSYAFDRVDEVNFRSLTLLITLISGGMLLFSIVRSFRKMPVP